MRKRGRAIYYADHIEEEHTPEVFVPRKRTRKNVCSLVLETRLIFLQVIIDEPYEPLFPVASVDPTVVHPGLYQQADIQCLLFQKKTKLIG